MDMLWAYLGPVLGLLAGAMLVWYWVRGRESITVRMISEERAKERMDLERRAEELSARLSEAQQEQLRLTAALASETELNRSLREKLAEHEAGHARSQELMKQEFKLIANELLEQKGKLLTDQQHERLGTLLAPFQVRIKEFEEQVRKAYETEGRERDHLQKEISKLVEQNQRLSSDADNLTRALKGDSRAQGAWGEMLLEKLLENSGLVKGEHYTLQESTTLSDGSRMRPDAVVSLPENKCIVIDAKVSLVHYEAYTSNTDEALASGLLKAHVDSLRTHAKGLAEKDYTRLYGERTVDFVLMFVPIEPAFLVALRERPETFQEAYDKGVVMVTHTTLMATLRTVQSIWKNESITRNHVEIAERAGRLYDKFVGFTEDLIKVGKQMDLAKGAYSDAMGKLTEGSGNLVGQVEKLKKLGAKSNKTISPALLKRSVEDELEEEEQQGLTG